MANNSMIEFERRFLLISSDINAILLNSKDVKHINSQYQRIEQFYVNDSPEKTIRIRKSSDYSVSKDLDSKVCQHKTILSSNKYIMTVKGKKNHLGIGSEVEFPIDINSDQATALYKFGNSLPIVKNRFLVTDVYDQFWEIDVFVGNLWGIIIAEIELDPNQTGDNNVKIPDFLIKADEITDNSKMFSNASLSKVEKALFGIELIHSNLDHYDYAKGLIGAKTFGEYEFGLESVGAGGFYVSCGKAIKNNERYTDVRDLVYIDIRSISNEQFSNRPENSRLVVIFKENHH